MSISKSFDITQMSWQGFRNPALPIGAWEVSAALTGDASGNPTQLNLVFRQSGKFQALAYSLERMSFFDSNGTTKAAELSTGGFDLNTVVSLELTASQTISALRLDKFKRMFLGVAQRAASTTFIAILTNNNNGAVVSIRAQGYVWGQRSILAEGGYALPVTNPWGSE